MSAKQAKAARKQLAAEHFPARQDTHESTVRHYKTKPMDAYHQPRENKFKAQGPYKTDVDHNRRIRRLARSLRITVGLAIEKYRSLTGLFRPVKMTDAERRAWGEKGKALPEL